MGDPVSLIIGGVLGLGSLSESRKARKDTKRARAVQAKSTKLQSARSAVQSIRQAQISRANVIQQGENQGVGGSSAVAGGAGSITTQSGSNIAFAQQLFSLQNSARRLQDSAMMHSANSSGLGTLSGLAVSDTGSKIIDKAFA